jgi:hypothetical protein
MLIKNTDALLNYAALYERVGLQELAENYLQRAIRAEQDGGDEWALIQRRRAQRVARHQLSA